MASGAWYHERQRSSHIDSELYSSHRNAKTLSIHYILTLFTTAVTLLSTAVTLVQSALTLPQLCTEFTIICTSSHRNKSPRDIKSNALESSETAYASLHRVYTPISTFPPSSSSRTSQPPHPSTKCSALVCQAHISFDNRVLTPHSVTSAERISRKLARL
jgi:hypothetical protein